jgi:hypothetical protein
MMQDVAYYAVIREAGAGWDASRTLRAQEKWDEHADFMEALVEDGFVLLGGPLEDGPKTLLIVKAESEASHHQPAGPRSVDADGFAAHRDDRALGDPGR